MKKRAFIALGISCILFLVLLINSFLYLRISPFAKVGFSVVISESYKDVFTDPKTTELIKGEKIKGEFYAQADNLGIVLIRFYNHQGDNPLRDKVVFRIKKKGEEKWHYENTYGINQFQQEQYFTFGFPKIPQSEGKIYSFEIESLSGKKTIDATSLSKKHPRFASAYQFSKNDLKNFNKLTFFVSRKIFYAVTHVNYLPVIFSFPLFFLLITIVRNIKIKLVLSFWRKRDEIIKNLFLFFKRAVTKIRRALFFAAKSLQSFSLQTLKIIKKHENYSPFLHIFIILLIALVARISFYWDPKNFPDLFFGPLGGYGDYDQLIRHSMRFVWNNDLVTYYWSLINDYAVNIRLFAFFFKFFGFINGLDYVTYFLIFLSSLVCLLPFLFLSRLKKFSLGGFIASMFLAINPISIWISTARPLDTLTSFFFSLFIIVFILSLEKKSYLLAFLLGAIGFLDVFNRPFMIFNDASSLILFAFYFLLAKRNLSTKLPFIKIAKADLLYAFTPFLIFGALYAGWNVYYTVTFNELWIFAPSSFATTWNPIHNEERILGTHVFDRLSNYFILLILTIEKLSSYMNIPAVILFGLTSLILLDMKRKRRIKSLLLSVFIPILFVGGLFYLQQFLASELFFKPDLSNIATRYFLDLNGRNFLLLLVFLEVTALQLAFLGRDFIKFAITIIVYMFVLGYGLYARFSERHFIQVLLPFFIIFGFSIDKLLVRFSFKRKPMLSLFFAIFVVGTVLFLGWNITQNISSFISNVSWRQKEISYLRSASQFIPQDGKILVGMYGENAVLISRYTKRNIVLNIKNPDPILIPTGKQYFHIPITTNRTGTVYNFSDELDTDFKMAEILQDKNIFLKYKFFILDYEVEQWNKILTNKDAGHTFFPINTFTLRRLNDPKEKRAIYQLIRLN